MYFVYETIITELFFYINFILFHFKSFFRNFIKSYGDFETVRNERYFNYLNKQSFSAILKDTGFTILETYITGDVRADRASEQWLNIVMRKSE